MASTGAPASGADGVQGPIPLSFPAILRNPQLNDRFSHLQSPTASPSATRTSRTPSLKLAKNEKEGKRWLRRRDNARFTSNPHVVLPTSRDFSMTIPAKQPTFPEPLPPYLPRTASMPSPLSPAMDPVSADAGRFSLSLKGMRRELRKSGARAQILVQTVENEIIQWLWDSDVILFNPNEVNERTGNEGRLLGSTGIREVCRFPEQLVWNVSNDAFARYVVHCVSRWHNIVSYSKSLPESEIRVTYLLRPNVTRPDVRARSSLETPPTTDLDRLSTGTLEQDDSDVVSDQESMANSAHLETLAEDEPFIPISSSLVHSIIEEDADVDAGISSSDDSSFVPLGSRSPSRPHNELDSEDDEVHIITSPALDDRTPVAPQRVTRLMQRTPLPRRAPSSPSRSPSPRLRPRRRVASRMNPSMLSYGPASKHRSATSQRNQTFWAYLFA